MAIALTGGCLKAPICFMWTRIGVCSILERYRHAGVSTDGKLCFVTEYDDVRYAAWAVDTEAIIWGPIENLDESIPGQILKDKLLTITDGPAKGSYRIIGLGCNYPLLEHSGLRLELDKKSEDLTLISTQTEDEVQRIQYEDNSGDWALGTFSDDGSSIIVLTPYNVTFFRHT